MSQLGYSVSISGSHNDSNLVLGSSSGSINEQGLAGPAGPAAEVSSVSEVFQHPEIFY